MSPPERRASVDVFWRSKEGFEMHLQLNGASSEEVLDEAQEAIGKIVDGGGGPRPAGAPEEGEAPPAPDKKNPPKCSVCGKKMVYREGESRTGKPYKGFFCADQDCAGKPVWVND